MVAVRLFMREQARRRAEAERLHLQRAVLLVEPAVVPGARE